ncbi:MAG: hypothetical protein RQ736_11360 [Thiogranum sp.]|nr:hypothetical protein [Thiogranum sp.]
MQNPAKDAAVVLEEKVAFLRRPESYPEAPARVEAIETHMSWVFLTDIDAYKLKKPIRREFLDFSTLEARRTQCANEVRLNRRLARHVYLGTVALVQTPSGQLQLDGTGRPVDYLVHMRRLPRERMLDALIERNAVHDADLEGLAGILVGFFRAAEPRPLSKHDYVERFRRDIEANWRDLVQTRYGLPCDRVDQLLQAQLAFLQRHQDTLAQRAGHVIEGHGDLRPQHVCLLDPPVVIDCLEFNPAFRMLDPLDELAYLSLECDRLQAPQVGERLLRDCMSAMDDRSATTGLIAFYKVYQACLRAKIAIWHLDDPVVDDHQHWKQRACDYLSLAMSYVPCLSVS